MKRFIPARYTCITFSLYFILPILLFYVALNFINYSRIQYTIIGFSVVILVFGPYIYWRFLDGASVIIDKTMITNLVRDGTYNEGWAEEISRIQSVALVDNIAVKKYYYNCKSKKALLIDFGRGNVKYIAMDEFTKGQRKRLLELLQKRTQGNRKPNDGPLAF